MISSVFHLADGLAFDPLRVVIEQGAPMNPAGVPPRHVSKYRPLLDRMDVNDSCVLERDVALAFLRWLRTQPGVKASQSVVGPGRMRVMIRGKS